MYPVGLHALDNSVQTDHAVDTALVVLVGSTGGGIALVVAETFHEVEAVAVDVIRLHPVSEGIGPLLLHQRIVLVPVVEHTPLVRSHCIVERIGFLGIHHIPGMDAVALVEHYIEHHCHAQTVAFLHKVLVVGGRAIGLVGSHVEVGVVSPALVAAEFHYGKQLDYVHTQFLQIR